MRYRTVQAAEHVLSVRITEPTRHLLRAAAAQRARELGQPVTVSDFVRDVVQDAATRTVAPQPDRARSS